MFYIFTDINKKNRFAEKKTLSIVQQTRSTIYAVDANGECTALKRVIPPKKVVKTPKAKSVYKKKPTPKPNKKKLNLTDSRAKQQPLHLPTCKIKLVRLSKSDIREKIAQVERDGKVRAIKERIKSLPRK